MNYGLLSVFWPTFIAVITPGIFQDRGFIQSLCSVWQFQSHFILIYVIQFVMIGTNDCSGQTSGVYFNKVITKLCLSPSDGYSQLISRCSLSKGDNITSFKIISIAMQSVQTIGDYQWRFIILFLKPPLLRFHAVNTIHVYVSQLHFLILSRDILQVHLQAMSIVNDYYWLYWTFLLLYNLYVQP